MIFLHNMMTYSVSE